MLAMLSVLELLIVVVVLAAVIGAGIIVYAALKLPPRNGPPDSPKHD